MPVLARLPHAQGLQGENLQLLLDKASWQQHMDKASRARDTLQAELAKLKKVWSA
jgi:hypothetical protein